MKTMKRNHKVKMVLMFVFALMIVMPAMTLKVTAANGVKDQPAYYSSDYRKWDQLSSAYPEMREVGCLITAQSKMLFEAGVSKDLMNPDYWYEWLWNNDCLVGPPYNLNMKDFNGCVRYASSQGVSMEYFGGDWDYSENQIWFNINAGYFTICNVGRHYVLIDNQTSKNTGTLHIYDSGLYYGNNSPCLLSKYTVKQIHVYHLVGESPKASTQPIQGTDETKPVIKDAKVISLDDTGYTIQCKVTDNKKVNRVQCPTWTKKNEQDDIANDWGYNKAVKAVKKGKNTYEFRVNISDHNNEYGTYNSHIYAYDDSGNYAVTAINDIVVYDNPILKDDGWYYCSVLPKDVNSDNYNIEYNNHYERIQVDSPGSDWKKKKKVKDEWQNIGEPFTSEIDLDVSDGSLILMRSIYYHFCGANANGYGNYYQTDIFNHYDEIDTSAYSTSVLSTGNDEGHTFYLLKWNDGLCSKVYCDSETTCDGSWGHHGERCQVWYKQNTYQKREKVILYKYVKNSGWVKNADDASDTTKIRYKIKDKETKKQKNLWEDFLKI